MTVTTKRLRILLLSPRGPLYRRRGGIWKKPLRYAPLTLTALASLIPAELNAEVTLIDEGIEELNLDARADLIGISAITGSAPRAYELADHFRRRGVPVALGGAHPTLMPAEALQYADAVVIGDAEGVCIDIAQNSRLLDLMAKSGCIAALIGLESLDERNLRQIKKSTKSKGPGWAAWRNDETYPDQAEYWPYGTQPLRGRSPDGASAPGRHRRDDPSRH